MSLEARGLFRDQRRTAAPNRRENQKQSPEENVPNQPQPELRCLLLNVCRLYVSYRKHAFHSHCSEASGIGEQLCLHLKGLKGHGLNQETWQKRIEKDCIILYIICTYIYIHIQYSIHVQCFTMLLPLTCRPCIDFRSEWAASSWAMSR